MFLFHHWCHVHVAKVLPLSGLWRIDLVEPLLARCVCGFYGQEITQQGRNLLVQVRLVRSCRRTKKGSLYAGSLQSVMLVFLYSKSLSVMSVSTKQAVSS